MASVEKNGPSWRGRYIRPDGSRGSTDPFTTKSKALTAAQDEESRIRHNVWTDPRLAETLFSAFAEDWYIAVKARLAPATAAKYRSHLDRQLLPMWASWPMITIFNSHLEIEKWISELVEDHAESSIASYFALFSTIMTAAVHARLIPASPCAGVRVTAGGYETEKLVATPVQVLRASMRLYETAGMCGFVLCLLDAYTGGRWGELAGQTPDEYDPDKAAISLHRPLKEVAGKLVKDGQVLTAETTVAPGSRRPRRKRSGRGKTVASERWVTLPPSIAVLYELLIESHDHDYVFTAPEGGGLYRGHFRQRFWRPAWDGVNPDDTESPDHRPAVLRWFTFHEGRHTQSTWLANDDIPEVARRARLGHKMPGIARIYEHVTPEMEERVMSALEARWDASLLALDPNERDTLCGWVPHLKDVYADLSD